MSARKLKPTGQRLLVDPLQSAPVSSGGIHLAPTYQQPSGQAIILAVGAGITEPDLKPGARVFYNWLNGRDVEHDGRTCRLLHLDEVLGVALSSAANGGKEP